ncbi:MAG: hypothetical protein QOJ24_876 [Mycobacterium sp.]|jgi:hypothetical protein|nr:hypothetical protein [Mycobacterium sp.]
MASDIFAKIGDIPTAEALALVFDRTDGAQRYDQRGARFLLVRRTPPAVLERQSLGSLVECRGARRAVEDVRVRFGHTLSAHPPSRG